MKYSDSDINDMKREMNKHKDDMYNAHEVCCDDDLCWCCGDEE